MKPDTEAIKPPVEEPTPITGDAIGDTAYSERFVLKLLLKFANLDTLKDEIQEKSFEEDLCTLWDMTAEPDVVQFLQKHKIFNLFSFALPVIDSPRIVEVIIGIIGNMCCQKEVVEDLLKVKTFLSSLLELLSSDDSLVLIQVLRLVTSSLFQTDPNYIPTWMELFKKVSFSETLYFILKNSSNKDLLVNALENFNTVCSYCNKDECRTDFFNQFVKSDAIEALTTALLELTVTQSNSCEREELERILVISLQISLNLIGFDKSVELLSSSKAELTNMIEVILNYYNNKIVNQKEIDMDLTDVIDSTNTIVKVLNISESCNTDKYFEQSYSMWQALQLALNSEQNGSSGFEDDDKEQLRIFTREIDAPLCTLICRYMEKCTDDNLLKVLDKIGSNLEDILGRVSDADLLDVVSKRTANYRSRLKDSVNSQ